MRESSDRDVARPREEPTHEQVLGVMDSSRGYSVADLLTELDGEGIETNRWTVRERLEDLANEGRVRRVDHENGSVTYQLPYHGLNPDTAELVEAHADHADLDFETALEELVRAGADALDTDDSEN